MDKQQHRLAVRLLKQLGVQYLRLEPDPLTGMYRYTGWTTPLVAHNGHAAQKSGKAAMTPKSRS
jgi:hypothetical protein